MKLDFIYDKYTKLIQTIDNSEYATLTVQEYLKMEKKPDSFIIIRHDVDLDPLQQVKFAELENRSGIKSSYYFRHTEEILNVDVIDHILSLGHEIGYHYETMTKARGDKKKALELFSNELDFFQKKWNVKTICPHGGSYVEGVNGYSITGILKMLSMGIRGKKIFSKWDSRDIWETRSMDEFGLIGDAHLSVDFTDILYLSDTGRSWDERYKSKDVVNSDISLDQPIMCTDDIIRTIREGNVRKIYLLIHFEQWKKNLKDWISWYLAQIIRRNGKKFVNKFLVKETA